MNKEEKQKELYPLEFYIDETPKSAQAERRSQENWRNTVGKAARARVDETVEWTFLDQRQVAVTIFYFPPEQMVGDIDNIIKPILDGMKNIAYLDDRLVERIVAQKFEPENDWLFADTSSSLAAALDLRPPVVYIRVDDDLSWKTISNG